MTTIVLWMLAAILATGLLVGWLADMTPKETGIQLVVMSAAGAVMIGLVSLLYTGV